MDYNNDLQTLKSSFIGGGEGSFYLRALSGLYSPQIEWLDVGIGRTARVLNDFLEFCYSRGHRLTVTGVDPDAGATPSPGKMVEWNFVKSRFEDWDSKSRFDLINADQSLYYMDDLEFQFSRLVNFLKPGGILIATCWSDEDTLHQIRQKLFPGAANDLTGEQLLAQFAAHDELVEIEFTTFRTHVNLGMWRQDKRLLEAGVKIIARGQLSSPIDLLCLRLLEIIGDFSEVSPRVNMAISARRGPNGVAP